MSKPTDTQDEKSHTMVAAVHDLNGVAVVPGRPLPPLLRTAEGKLFIRSSHKPLVETNNVHVALPNNSITIHTILYPSPLTRWPMQYEYNDENDEVSEDDEDDDADEDDEADDEDDDDDEVVKLVFLRQVPRHSVTIVENCKFSVSSRQAAKSAASTSGLRRTRRLEVCDVGMHRRSMRALVETETSDELVGESNFEDVDVATALKGVGVRRCELRREDADDASVMSVPVFFDVFDLEAELRGNRLADTA